MRPPGKTKDKAELAAKKSREDRGKKGAQGKSKGDKGQMVDDETGDNDSGLLARYKECVGP